MPRADAHIHLFDPSLQGTFPDRCGVQIDEAACYDSLAREHDVAAALVVCYAQSERYARNNEHVGGLIPRYDWVRPAAYVEPAAPPTMKQLEAWRAQGFIGLTMYPGDDAAAVAAVPDELWRWMIERRWLLSVNNGGAAWRAWLPVLARHPELRLVVSHLGLPAKVEAPIDAAAARDALAPQLELAPFPGVRVKLSGFYALTEPGWDYPHQLAWPYVEALLEGYGVERLLWGSDYSPSLNFHTFVQTLGLFDKMPFLDDAARGAITGANLLALLDEASS